MGTIHPDATIAAASNHARPYRFFWQRRRFWIWSVGLVVVAVVAFVACLPTIWAVIGFSRVRAGMTRHEVIALLGKPTSHLEYPRRSLINGDACDAWFVGGLSLYVNYLDDTTIGKVAFTDAPIIERFFSSYLRRHLL